jgi:hypothetical protein
VGKPVISVVPRQARECYRSAAEARAAPSRVQLNPEGDAFILPGPWVLNKWQVARDKKEAEERKEKERKQREEEEKKKGETEADRAQGAVDGWTDTQWHVQFARAPSAVPQPSPHASPKDDWVPAKAEWRIGTFDTEGTCNLEGKTHRLTCEATVLQVRVHARTGRQEHKVRSAYQGHWKLEQEMLKAIQEAGQMQQVHLLREAVHGIYSLPVERDSRKLHEGRRQVLEAMAECDLVLARDPKRENDFLWDLRGDPAFADLHDLAKRICVYEVCDFIRLLDPKDPSRSLAQAQNRPPEWKEEADRYVCGRELLGGLAEGPHRGWSRQRAEDFALRKLLKHKGRAGDGREEGQARARRQREERARKRLEMIRAGTIGQLKVHCHCSRRDCYECLIWGQQLGWNVRALDQAYRSLQAWRAAGSLYRE